MTKPSKWRAGWAAGRLAFRQAIGDGASARDVELGELLTGQLDEMKGLAMKIGQIVSYMGVPLSEPVQAKLAQLQTGLKGMSPEATRAVIQAEFGVPIEQLFEDFEIAPLAAASIGQVHRARFGGVPVAVKVQYPDVSGSFDADLGAIGRLASLASLASAVDGTAIVRELANRLEEECDYAREGRMQAAFASAFSGDVDIGIPGVVSERSGATVLTTQWIDGDAFEGLRVADDPARRDRAAAAMVRFSYRSMLNFATIQADPHPGNFRFMSDGRVAFLDFGCVRSFETDFIEHLRAMIRAIRDQDRAAFRDTCLELGVVGNPKRFNYDHFFMVMEHLHRPLLAQDFEFSEAYVREGYDFNGPTSPNSRYLAIPPAYVWVMRLQWGLWSILARLGARGSFAGVLDEALGAPIDAGCIVG